MATVKSGIAGTFLMVHWSRICLPMQGVWIRSLVKLRSHMPQLKLFCDPMDYSPPGSSVHGIFQARILEWVAMPSLLQGIIPTQESNQGLLHCRRILYQLSYLYLLTRRQTYHPPIHPSKFPSPIYSFLVDVLRNPSSLYCQPHTQFLTKKRNPSGFFHVFFCQHSERALVKEETPHSRTGPGLSV